ncbi:hypothetical protein DFH06DRAFT_1342729 [Mycena polygramma]|nr:hypothetical protein DFH06DRAFT_1342729 [Mycena polygramma]
MPLVFCLLDDFLNPWIPLLLGSDNALGALLWAQFVKLMEKAGAIMASADSGTTCHSWLPAPHLVSRVLRTRYSFQAHFSIAPTSAQSIISTNSNENADRSSVDDVVSGGKSLRAGQQRHFTPPGGPRIAFRFSVTAVALSSPVSTITSNPPEESSLSPSHPAPSAVPKRWASILSDAISICRRVDFRPRDAMPTPAPHDATILPEGYPSILGTCAPGVATPLRACFVNLISPCHVTAPIDLYPDPRALALRQLIHIAAHRTPTHRVSASARHDLLRARPSHGAPDTPEYYSMPDSARPRLRCVGSHVAARPASCDSRIHSPSRVIHDHVIFCTLAICVAPGPLDTPLGIVPPRQYSLSQTNAFYRPSTYVPRWSRLPTQRILCLSPHDRPTVAPRCVCRFRRRSNTSSVPSDYRLSPHHSPSRTQSLACPSHPAWAHRDGSPDSVSCASSRNVDFAHQRWRYRAVVCIRGVTNDAPCARHRRRSDLTSALRAPSPGVPLPRYGDMAQLFPLIALSTLFAYVTLFAFVTGIGTTTP